MIITSESVSGAVFGIVMICWFVFAATFLLRKRPPSTQEKRRDNAARFGMALEGLAFACVWTFRRPFSVSIFPSDLSLEIAVGFFTVALAIVSTVLVNVDVLTDVTFQTSDGPLGPVGPIGPPEGPVGPTTPWGPVAP